MILDCMAKASVEWRRRKRAEDPEFAQRERDEARERMRRRAADPELAAIDKVKAKERLARKRAARTPEEVEAERLERNQYHRDYQRRKKAEDPTWRSRYARYTRAFTYGLTRKQVDQLLASHRCEVCGRDPGFGKDGQDLLHIDHRHDNGAVRGALCGSCNRAAAFLDRSPELVDKLIEYVNRGKPKVLPPLRRGDRQDLDSGRGVVRRDLRV